MSDFNLSFTDGEDVSLAVDDGERVRLCFTDAPIGTRDYNALTNKPSIEGHTLIGDSTLPQIGVNDITPQSIDNIIYG